MTVDALAMKALAALIVLSGCPEPLEPAATPDVNVEVVSDAQPDLTPAPDDFEAQPDDFECLTNWTRVRSFYITNKAGRLNEALAVAEDPEGRAYPVGTIIQLVPFEAMVKREAGWSPVSNDWEFFSLDNTSDGTTILARGVEGVENQFGAECLPCHAKAQPEWDLICEDDHGCDPLNLTDFIIDSFVSNDDRCP